MDSQLSAHCSHTSAHASQTTPWTSEPRSMKPALVAQISASLGELMNENPQVADLLAGRTFARTLH